MAELFGCSADNISLHLKNIYKDNELDESSTAEVFSVVQIEGKREVTRSITCYSLEAIIAVGYRVNSERGTQFRQWAITILQQYIHKGFAIDNDRFKYGSRFSTMYFDDLLEEIRDIRSSERMLYQKITDIYATSIDYSPKVETTKQFFATVQNKLHFAITGHTAAEIISKRADSSKQSMGLTSWRKGPHGKIYPNDITIAKNYLNKDELDHLNRILNEQKSHGNILCFRNLKKATDEAIALFSNKEAKEVILLPPYEEMAFIQAFRELMRIRNVLTSFSDFSWDDLPMREQSFEDYKSKYLDLHEKVKSDHQKEKCSILEDVDFELELIHRDEINVAYILKLLARLKQAEDKDVDQQKKAIMDLLTGEIDLRSKRELIEKFIGEHIPKIDDVDTIPDEFEKYWQDQKVLALGRLCEEEHLDQKQFQALIDAYIFSEQEPLREEVFKCLDNRPRVLEAREIGERIIDKMKTFVEVFVLGMAA
jgi:hypothetical protein